MQYQTIALHPTTACNMYCPMCYRPKDEKQYRSKQFFIDLIKELVPYTDQISLGGGEPMLDQPFLIDLGKEAKKCNMIFNVTTNGTIPMQAELAPYITMISVSLDKYKRPTKEDFHSWVEAIKQLQNQHKMRVGVNLLMEPWLFEPPQRFIALVDYLFKAIGVERVFALTPKRWKSPDILKYRDILLAMSTMHHHFYVDDLTYMIITEGTYGVWTKPCHYGTSMLSIDERGRVKGCSFAQDVLLSLEKPQDIHKIKEIVVAKRHTCPYFEKPDSEPKPLSDERQSESNAGRHGSC